MIKSYFIAYGSTLITFLILDFIWLGVVSKESYTNAIGHLLRDKYPVLPWVLFYLLYSFAIVFLVVMPNISTSFVKVAITGAVLGMAAYAAYNLTNYAVIKGWPLGITIKDWVWGITVTTLSSLAGWYSLKL